MKIYLWAIVRPSESGYKTKTILSGIILSH